MSEELFLRIDALLRRFYAEKDDAKAEAVLDELIPCVISCVRRGLLARGVRYDDAEDHCQDCSVRLLQALRRSRERGSGTIDNIIGFANTTAYHLYIDDSRHRKHTLETTSLDTLVETENGASATFEGDVLSSVIFQELLWPAICRLPLLHRAALLLKMEGDMLKRLARTWEEAARGLGMDPSDLGGLPLTDREIALRLRISPGEGTTAENRVSNLRSGAKTRLRPYSESFLKILGGWDA